MTRVFLRVFFVSAVLLLGVAGVALAHVHVDPAEVPPGQTQTFTASVPTELDVPTTEVRLEVPEGFELTGVEAPAGWRAEREDNAIVWSGGEIAVEESEEFSFEARAPQEEGVFPVPAIQTYEDGTVVEWAGPQDSEEPAPVVRVTAGASGEASRGDDHGGEAEHLPESGGIDSALLYGAVGAVALASVVAIAVVAIAGRVAPRRR